MTTDALDAEPIRTPVASRPRSAIEVLDAAFTLYRRGFVRVTTRLAILGLPVIALVFVHATAAYYAASAFWLPWMVLAIAEGERTMRASDDGPVRAFLDAILDTIVVFFLWMLLALFLGASAFVLALPAIIGVFALQTQPMAAALVGILLGVPAFAALVFISIRISLVAPVWVTERDIGAFLRSWRLTKGAFWKILIALVVSSMITAAPSVIIAVNEALLSQRGELPGVGMAIGTWVVSILVTPYSAYVLLLLLHDRRAVREGADLMPERAAAV